MDLFALSIAAMNVRHWLSSSPTCTRAQPKLLCSVTEHGNGQILMLHVGLGAGDACSSTPLATV